MVTSNNHIIAIKSHSITNNMTDLKIYFSRITGQQHEEHVAWWVALWLHVFTNPASSYKLYTYYVNGNINSCLFSQNIFF